MRADWIELPKLGHFGMDAYRVAPAGDAARPTVIVLHEIFGVNESMCDVARMLANEGFEVLIPDLFWRNAPRISLGYVEPDRTRAGELLRQFDTDLGLADIGQLVAWLKQRYGAAHPVAAIGFCIGGKLATLLGARGEIDAGVSFYGIQLNDYVDEIANAKSRVLLHFGGQDAQIPLELVNRIEAASKPNRRVDIRVYPEAKHGFFNPTRAERYRAQAALEAGTHTLDLLREALELPVAS
jgi:carboxymethylenebutenolidase